MPELGPEEQKIAAEFALAAFGFLVTYAQYRWLTKKDWGTRTITTMVTEVVDTRPLGEHTEAAIRDVNERWGELNPYDDITVDNGKKEVQFWKKRPRFSQVANEGPNLKTRLFVSMAAAMTFLGSIGLTVDAANRAWDLWNK